MLTSEPRLIRSCHVPFTLAGWSMHIWPTPSATEARLHPLPLPFPFPNEAHLPTRVRRARGDHVAYGRTLKAYLVGKGKTSNDSVR